jgi:hypothetical protein
MVSFIIVVAYKYLLDILLVFQPPYSPELNLGESRVIHKTRVVVIPFLQSYATVAKADKI